MWKFKRWKLGIEPIMREFSLVLGIQRLKLVYLTQAVALNQCLLGDVNRDWCTGCWSSMLTSTGSSKSNIAQASIWNNVEQSSLPLQPLYPTGMFEAALYPWDGEAHSQVLHMAQRTVCSCQVILSPIVSNRTVNWRAQARGKQLQEDMHWIPAKARRPKNCHHFRLCSAFKM